MSSGKPATGIGRPLTPWRPQLRTKTGCLECRKRRKKCDETRPCCLACVRLGFGCSWGPNPSMPGLARQLSRRIVGRELKHTERSSPCQNLQLFKPCWNQALVTNKPRQIPRTVALRFPGLRSDTDQSLLLKFNKEFMPRLLRPHAHPQFLDNSYLINLALQFPWFMDSLLAFASSYFARKHGTLGIMVMQYYNGAVRGLRQVINTTKPTHLARDALLASTIFLGLFEVWNCNNPSQALLHFRAAAELLSLKRQDAGKVDSRHFVPFYRVAAESILFHFSLLTLFHSDLDQLAKKFPWQDLKIFLEYKPYPEAPSLENSPVLGNSHNLHRVVFEIVRLSRHPRLDTKDQIDALWRQAVSLEAESKSPLWFDSNSPEPPTEPLSPSGQQSLRLWHIALDLYVLTANKPALSCADLEIQERIRDGITILSTYPTDEHCAQYICWPITVIGSAVKIRADMAVVRQKLEEIWCHSYNGHVGHTIRFLEELWTRSGIQGLENGMVAANSMDSQRTRFTEAYLPQRAHNSPYNRRGLLWHEFET